MVPVCMCSCSFPFQTCTALIKYNLCLSLQICSHFVSSCRLILEADAWIGIAIWLESAQAPCGGRIAVMLAQVWKCTYLWYPSQVSVAQGTGSSAWVATRKQLPFIWKSLSDVPRPKTQHIHDFGVTTQWSHG